MVPSDIFRAELTLSHLHPLPDMDYGPHGAEEMGMMMTVLDQRPHQAWPCSSQEGGWQSHTVEKTLQIFINDIEKAAVGKLLPSQGSLCLASRKSGGGGATPGAEAWLFLTSWATCVSYFTFLNLGPLTGKTGIILPTS